MTLCSYLINSLLDTPSDSDDVNFPCEGLRFVGLMCIIDSLIAAVPDAFLSEVNTREAKAAVVHGGEIKDMDDKHMKCCILASDGKICITFLTLGNTVISLPSFKEQPCQVSIRREESCQFSSSP